MNRLQRKLMSMQNTVSDPNSKEGDILNLSNEEDDDIHNPNSMEDNVPDPSSEVEDVTDPSSEEEDVHNTNSEWGDNSSALGMLGRNFKNQCLYGSSPPVNTPPHPHLSLALPGRHSFTGSLTRLKWLLLNSL
ncbi:hypothetical protein DPEC_G00112400 [Dallia pectoralis]|uniref:Uncharacterized protein n=1 Tax=Dallia pectoralis TaxID=75939 RepID=A0ACC2GU53_DALPE|nr:hypothetical protein DPEC_G00112400 [Dallia pectoralis]